MKTVITLVLVALSATAFAADAAKVYFKAPKDHALVPKEFKVEFGLEGMKIQPAGTKTAGTGHHHLLIDTGPVAQGQPIPNDATHLHFGKGQTETTVKLSPGMHKLTLQFADGAHMSYGPEMSSTIEVHVK